MCDVCKSQGPRNPFFGKVHSQETKEKIRLTTLGMRRSVATEFTSSETSGKKNTMYGKTIRDVWVEKHGEVEADRLSRELSAKRSKNAIGERNSMYGKPTPQGSGNGWKGWYRGWFFRSLRELSYAIILDEQGILWRTADTEDLRMKYTDPLGRQRTYVADFLVAEKTLVEIKPTRLLDTPLVRAKRDAAIEFARLKG